MSDRPLATREQFETAYAIERAHEYPAIDAFEERLGYRIDRHRLEDMARVLACPVKEHLPNWQHGRVLYAVARARLARGDVAIPLFVDIGTAKGFSALCLHWAARDAGLGATRIYSVDTLDPRSRVRRNSVLELSGFKTIEEFVAPWVSGDEVWWLSTSDVVWQRMRNIRAHLVFIDGKHTYEAVREDARRFVQEQGDVLVFDDVQIPGVRKAVEELRGYEFEVIHLEPAPGVTRIYVIAWRT